jgi:hypothetical protein
MGWYFLWGQFRGSIFFGVRSEVDPTSTGGNAVGALIYGGWNFKPAQQLRVSKFCESEMATKDTHLVLWSTRPTQGISASC